MRLYLLVIILLVNLLISGCGGGSSGGGSPAPTTNQSTPTNPTPAPTPIPTPSTADFAISKVQETGTDNYLVSIEKVGNRQIDFASFEVNRDQGEYFLRDILTADVAGRNGNSLSNPGFVNITPSLKINGLPTGKSLAKFRLVPKTQTSTLPNKLEVKVKGAQGKTELGINFNDSL